MDDKKRYLKQCEELISIGYFILEDGSKSCDKVKTQSYICSQATKEEKTGHKNFEGNFKSDSSELFGKNAIKRVSNEFS